MRYALGIDMGGTKILAGVIDLKSGAVVSSAKRKSRADQGPDELTANLIAAADEAISAAKEGKPEAIGIGAAGQVDREKGLLISGPNLGERMDNLPLGPTLKKRFDLPVVVGNDVVKKIARVPTGPRDKPVQDVVIQRVEIFRSETTPAS